MGEPEPECTLKKDGCNCHETAGVEQRQIVNPTRFLPPSAGWTPMEEFWKPEDLDRCLHGRHSLDPCFSCPGGQSTGNEFLRAGQRIGTNRLGEPIVAVVNRRTA